MSEDASARTDQEIWCELFNEELANINAQTGLEVKNACSGLEAADKNAGTTGKPGKKKTAQQGSDNQQKDNNYLTGICLSGGGVRSAVVSMGALKALAEAKMLRHFDYISSVSGGGYTGAALSHWLANTDDEGDVDDATPFFVRHDKETGKATGPDIAQREGYDSFVRRHISYLLPGGMRGLFQGIYVVARTILMNLFLWLVLGSAAVALVMAMSAGLHDLLLSGREDVFSQMTFGLVHLVHGYLGIPSGFDRHFLFTVSLLISGGSVAILLLGFFLYPLGTYWVQTPRRNHDKQTPTNKYKSRIYYEKYGGKLLLIAVATFVFGSIPAFYHQIPRITEWLGVTDGTGEHQFFGLIATLIGIFSAVFGFIRTKISGSIPGISKNIVVIGSGFFIYGVVILAYWIANFVWYGDSMGIPREAMYGLVLAALVLCIFVNVNDVSLGRFYRDRLMETFLPNPDQVELNPDNAVGKVDPKARDEESPPPASRADVLKLTDLSAQRPIHLICGTVMAPNSDKPYVRKRLGDGFVMSKRMCGSDETGWLPTEEVAGGNLRLPTAMAASGAAANPFGAFGGEGPTASSITALAMAILSLRLGYWLRWPGFTITMDTGFFKRLFMSAWWNPYGNRISPSFLSTMASILRWRFVAKQSNFREIGDGGFFENLGIYELVRRRCGLIVVCDGGEDPDASYGTFALAARRVKDDFGVDFEFDIEVDTYARDKRRTQMRLSSPADLVGRKTDDEFPKGAEFARKGYFLARIKYGDPDENNGKARASGPSEGLLIYLKSAMLPSNAHTTKSYRATNPKFPYDSTVNQFFSPQQFDAYRDVGYSIARQMIEDTCLDKLFIEGGQPKRPRLENLLLNYAFQRRGPSEG